MMLMLYTCFAVHFKCTAKPLNGTNYENFAYAITHARVQRLCDDLQRSVKFNIPNRTVLRGCDDSAESSLHGGLAD